MLLQDFHQEAGPAVDSDEAWLGVGLVLESCARTIWRSSRQIEELEIESVKDVRSSVEDLA